MQACVAISADVHKLIERAGNIRTKCRHCSDLRCNHACQRFHDFGWIQLSICIFDM